MENNFDMHQWRANHLEKLVKEEKALDMSREASQALEDAYENVKKVYATFGRDSRFNDVVDKADEQMILSILQAINNKLLGHSDNIGYGSGAKLGYKGY